MDLLRRFLGGLVGCLLRWSVCPPGAAHRTLTHSHHPRPGRSPAPTAPSARCSPWRSGHPPWPPVQCRCQADKRCNQERHNRTPLWGAIPLDVTDRTDSRRGRGRCRSGDRRARRMMSCSRAASRSASCALTTAPSTPSAGTDRCAIRVALATASAWSAPSCTSRARRRDSLSMAAWWSATVASTSCSASARCTVAPGRRPARSTPDPLLAKEVTATGGPAAAQLKGTTRCTVNDRESPWVTALTDTWRARAGIRGWTAGPAGATLGLRLTNQPGLMCAPGWCFFIQTRGAQRACGPGGYLPGGPTRIPPRCYPGGRGPRRVAPVRRAGRSTVPLKSIPGSRLLIQRIDLAGGPAPAGAACHDAGG
jgi:hypothetical protein